MEDRGFVSGGFEMENGVFTRVYTQEELLADIRDHSEAKPFSEKIEVDLQGKYVIPGLIDIHIHGAVGADFSDGDEDGLLRMGRYLAGHGITGFAPTSMTLPYAALEKAFAAGLKVKKQEPFGCARVLGIHMEGPFFSEKKKGAQNAAYLRKPDIQFFYDLYERCEGLIKIVDIAAELEGAVPFTKAAGSCCTVSIAHSDAGYEAAKAVYEAGARHLTHLFNAMPPIHHRNPGVIGAASENEAVVAELICDGIHVHPSAVRLAFKMFPGRLCLISDALRCLGMPDGSYILGGQSVNLKDHIARLSDGTIAGAASDLYDDMRNAVSFGIDKTEAIRAATILPAKEIGADQEVGSITAGKRADFVVCREDLTRERVFLGGTEVTE